jgi:peptidoglycan/LPS O-acetylase OafA/YrhL
LSGTTPPSSALARRLPNLFARPANNIDALDGLRAIAILTVTAFHTTVFSSFATGELELNNTATPLQQFLLNMWSGVDIFFVLSGFLIGRILIRDLKSHGSVFYPSFFLRRSLRIFPAYYFVLTLSLVAIVPGAPKLYAYLWGTVDPGLITTSAWANYVYLSNYLTPSGTPNIMSWAWSLCIEEHFYIVLPPLLWLTMRGPRSSARLHAIGLGVGLLLPFLARVFVYLDDPYTPIRDIYFLSHYRFDELFVGVVVAYATVHHPEALARFAKRAGLALPLAGMAAIASVWALGSAHWGNPFRILFQFPLLSWGTAALLVHGLHVQGPVTRSLSWRGWFPVARVSYGMYLVHPLVLFQLLVGPFGTIFGDPNSGWVWIQLYLCVVVGSWAISALMFSLLERPLLDLGGRLSKRMRA